MQAKEGHLEFATVRGWAGGSRVAEGAAETVVAAVGIEEALS